jgi:hypothetical protein
MSAARPEDNIQRSSNPSDLKITDMRIATVGWAHWHFSIIRIDTNQGISGWVKCVIWRLPNTR